MFLRASLVAVVWSLSLAACGGGAKPVTQPEVTNQGDADADAPDTTAPATCCCRHTGEAETTTGEIYDVDRYDVLTPAECAEESFGECAEDAMCEPE